MVEPVDDFGLVEIELLGDRPIGLLDQRQAVLDRRQNAAIARIGAIVAARARWLSPRGTRCTQRKAETEMVGPEHRQIDRLKTGLSPDALDSRGDRAGIGAGDHEPQIERMGALVIMGDERLAADDRRHLFQPLGGNLQRRQRAGADGVRPHHRADPRDHPDLAQATKNPDRFARIERRGAADDLERFVDQREIMLPAIDQCQFGGIRAHCPILVARAVKKMPDGFCAEICPFFAKVAAS